jgi:cytochrome c peroxidase
MIAKLLVTIVIPLGLDLFMPVPEGNPMTAAKVDLGRRLFFDRRLSADGKLSCASCHRPDRGFADPRPVSIGVFGRGGSRNAPALLNRGYGRTFFWDGRTTSLEEQVLRPIEDPKEMGSNADAAAARAGVTREELATALASYVRSILAGDAPFDRYASGDSSALTEEKHAGLKVFRGKGNCTACHIGPTFSDEWFHNTGVAVRDGRIADEGRFRVTSREPDRGAFKTPTLREVARTGPYMHDGSIATIEEVIDFYDRGGRANPGLDAEIRPLGLTTEEKGSLAAFLRSLSGTVTEGAASLAPDSASLLSRR